MHTNTAVLSAAAIACCLAAAPAIAAVQTDAEVKAALSELEIQSWVAWKAHDGKYFESFLSDDHVEVGFGGPIGKSAVVGGVASTTACTVESYKVGEMKFTRISPDVAVLVYRAEQNTKCGGAQVPSPVWATSVYVRRDGRWLNIVYEHTPAGK